MGEERLSQQPTNLNYLSPLGFRMTINRLPGVSFFCQKVSLPSIVLPTVTVPTPFVNIPMHGDRLQYGDLAVDFKVDEDMRNWSEIVDWIFGLSYPESFDQHAALAANGRSTGRGVASDGSIVVLTSAKNPNIVFNFKDLLPISISPTTMTATDTGVNHVTASVSFNFLNFSITRLSSD